MRPGYDQSPVNPVPAVVWALVLPMIAAEGAFLLGQTGFLGGAGGIGLRQNALVASAYVPQIVIQMWQAGSYGGAWLYRLLSYPFVQGSAMQAVFVIVFTLALGKMVAEAFRPGAVLAIFFGSAIGGALVYTIFAALMTGPVAPLMGGYPAVYGFVGAFTFLLWARLGQGGESRVQAFRLIGLLLLFQLVFGVIFGGSGYGWIAEVGGFATGFALCFVLVPGGWATLRRRIQRR